MTKSKPKQHGSIDNRDQLIYALTEVAELEHTLMCQYLFAAATMKEGFEELFHPDRRFHQIELIRGWKASLLRVAREEMQHLTYANNLLISVGGSPYFVRPNFPNVLVQREMDFVPTVVHLNRERTAA